MKVILQEEKKYWSLGWLWAVFLLAVPGCLQAQLTSKINGFFPKDWEGKQAMVVAKPIHGSPIIDTTTIMNRSATFTVRLGEPSPAYLWIEGNQDDIHFFIDSPTINIGIEPGAFAKPLITGSASSELWVDQLDFLMQIRESRPDLHSETFSALQAGDSLVAFKLEQTADSLRKVDDDQLISLIQNHPLLPCSWYLFASNSFSYSQTSRLFDSLSAFATYPSYRELNEKLDRKKLGNKAPDFSLPSPSGSVITLSKLERTYILVDFSSQYILPCQKRHYDLKKLYATYHPLGLEIVTVAFDIDKNAGIIPTTPDRLPWLQVLDSISQSSVMEAFAIDQMPDNLLLDANKIMIGRDMSVPELDEKLQQLLKK
ncbi:AhpC/TSA family protein [Spirosoma sp. KCTC 42546]|uniref:TlpA disulfide reductase family protein n=1 Tax=Spirosoma sp. KCTC 42546 TaxID=2520506 RepID=UPI001158B12D|nr:TlpA disulfide reductase family protein [Spirosoma sp. KCTC 42546]QDK81711.1 AhpC/TSA family protein [Spirosoma sp. KCTC 42546]